MNSRSEESRNSNPEVRQRRRRQPKTPGSAALAQIDKKLSQALDERTEAMHKVSVLVYWQDRLNKATQEVEYLIAAQQKLMGHPVNPVPVNYGPAPAVATSFRNAPFPEGIGSIPAKQPSPTSGNVAEDVGSEGGFN